MILSIVENKGGAKAKGTAAMGDSVHEALAFNEEVNRKSKRTTKTALHALLVTVIAGAYFVMTQWSEVIPAWVFLAFMVAMLGLLMWVGMYQGNVRPSYRQDPFKAPKPDKKFFGGQLLCLSPIFFRPFLEGHMVAAAVVFILWGIAAFWLLEAGVRDPATHPAEERAQASGDE